MMIKATDSKGSKIIDTTFEPFICKVGDSTEVMNLATGESLFYMLSPNNAVSCAFEKYTLKNGNTWTYNLNRGKASTDGKYISCGDFCVKL